MAEGVPWTFGVKFQFFLIYPKTDGFNRARTLITEDLQRPYHVPCSDTNCNAAWHKFELSLIPSNGLFMARQKDKSWEVDNDFSVKLEDSERHYLPDGYAFASVVIKSRKLSFDDVDIPAAAHSSTYHSKIDHIPWRQEIQIVLERLDDTFNGPNNDHNTRLVLNHACGLHVHIGRDTLGFPLQSICNLTSAYTAFERVIDSAMDANRIGSLATKPELRYKQRPENPTDFANAPGQGVDKIDEYVHGSIRPLSALHITNALHLRTNPCKLRDQSFWKYPAREADWDENLDRAMRRFDVPSWVYLIQRTTEEDNMADAFESAQDDIPALNVSHIYDHMVRRTVEFRQHGGSLDAVEISAWVDFVVSLTKWCHETNPREVVQAIHQYCFDPTFTFVDLARSLGVAESTAAHYENYFANDNWTVYHRAAVFERAYHPAPIAAFMKNIALNRFDALSLYNVMGRIGKKMAHHSYGHLPEELIKFVLGTEFAASNAGKLMTLGSRFTQAGATLIEDFDAVMDGMAGVSVTDAAAGAVTDTAADTATDGKVEDAEMIIDGMADVSLEDDMDVIE